MKYLWILFFGLFFIVGLLFRRYSFGTSVHEIRFFNQNYFDKGISQINTTSLPTFVPISGGIVPHDIFPSSIPARFMYFLSKKPPETIIIIGPNHNEKGNAKVLTSLYSWQTNSGTLQPNIELAKKLLKNHLVDVDESVLPEDHAAISIMPYLAYFMSNTRVVPLLLSSRLSLAEISSLADTIRNSINDKTTVIAAVDFSHYLSSPQAEMKDIETLQLIKSRDYRQLLTLGNDHLDSPASIVLLLQLMGDRQAIIIDHTNSGQIQNNVTSETTSYFSLFFPK